MNVLFLMKVYEVGGQEVVTAALAKCFVDHGNNVSIASFKQPNFMMVSRTDPRISFHTIGTYQYKKSNVEKLRDILLKEHIDIIINQWGLPYVPIKVARSASRELKVKIISVYHNDPSTNARIQRCDTALKEASNGLSKLLLLIKKKAFELITSKSMRYVYDHSDLYMVLSPSFIEPFCDFTHVKDRSKLIAQTNPVTIESPSDALEYSSKKKEIIYVGRIDCNQKRVDRIINMWAVIGKKHQDWTLTIVGDGPDKVKMKELAQSLSIKNISFEGFQNPVDYYKRASLLLLTSDFEGFGLVIVEGMSWGVVPIVYGSYSAVFDIISNQKDGVIIPPLTDGTFDQQTMMIEIERLINDDCLRQNIAENALIKGAKFSISAITDEWNAKIKNMSGGG